VKIKIRYIVIAVILASILMNIAVVMTNNRIADAMETLLREHPLPPETELLDSLSVAEKVDGNGNGMQYFGMILVQSSLTEEQLEEHYRAAIEEAHRVPVYGYADWISVTRQESPTVFEYRGYRFDNYQENADCYRISMEIYTVVGCEETFWEAILNTDWRGH